MAKKEIMTLKEIVGWLEGNEFLTVEEVAQRLRVHPGSVHEVIKRGCVTGYFIGKRRCFKRTDIEQLLERRRRRKN